eukprot:33506-Pyramimonas_sp.AAC.1
MTEVACNFADAGTQSESASSDASTNAETQTRINRHTQPGGAGPPMGILQRDLAQRLGANDKPREAIGDCE